MIIKTKTAIIDTNTYDSFFIEYRECRRDYRLLAVRKDTADTIPLYSNTDKEIVEEFLEDIYKYLNSSINKCDLGVIYE